MFKELDSKLDFPKFERDILAFWSDQMVFEDRRRLNEGGSRWAFMDGPITANNPMGVHHAWGRTYKDLYHRHKAMNGFDTRYQNGFDCQGLWVEVEVEKELGFTSKKDIETFGVAEFIKKCKQRVLKYAAVQTEQSIRLGYWMEWDDPQQLRSLARGLEDSEEVITFTGPRGSITGTAEAIAGQLGGRRLGGSYFTFSDENNYTIWAFLKRCSDRGLVYKGRDSMPWCPRCSTALSQHEIVTEGYRETTHKSVVARLPLRGRPGEWLLVWTTTPWTLSANVGVAVNPDLKYVKIVRDVQVYYLASGALAKTFPDGNYRVLAEIKGASLEGWSYDGPFDELPIEQGSGAVKAHRVIPWHDVSELEGTGLVHIAPGCGQEDMELGRIHDLPIVVPLDEYGVFVEGLGWLTGTHVYDSPDRIIDSLKQKALLVKEEDYKHRYPFCWRCGSELVFRVVDEWFISMGDKLDKPLDDVNDNDRVSSLRYQIIESARQVRWLPAFGLKQELDWLLNMDDWMISKKRYWGLALPIWECSNCGGFEVIGGKEELEERAVEGWEEFKGHSPHRPWIDKVKIKCTRCGATMSRIPDVGNPWLDAGIVSFSTLDYRADPKHWRAWFPADFVTECFPGQFRNWFYSMLAMGTVMAGETPFRQCLGHGTVLDEQGREMHKSSGNMIMFDDAADTIGSDVMRWMYCLSKPEYPMLFGYKAGEKMKREFFIPLVNIANFFAIYANLDKWTPEKSSEKATVLDRWALSKLNSVIAAVSSALEDFDALAASTRLQVFVDELSKWFVRRSRRRFWKSEDDEDKRAGYTTLYECIRTLAKLLAPFTPFVAELLHQNLVRSADSSAPLSVHLCSWPVDNDALIDLGLMDSMDLVMKAASLGHAARNQSGTRLRQPLSRAWVLAEPSVLASIAPLEGILKDELNIKSVTLTGDEAEIYQYSIRPRAHLLGRKHGRIYSKIVSALSQIKDQSLARRAMNREVIQLAIEDQVVELLPDEVDVQKTPVDGLVIVSDQQMTVALSKEISSELKTEGLARDVVRRVQYLRKQAAFNIDDKIETYYEAPREIADVIVAEADYIAAETLSLALREGQPPAGAAVQEFDIGGKLLKLGLVRRT